MEASLLAIAGGAAPLVAPNASANGDENELLAKNPFQNMMQSATRAVLEQTQEAASRANRAAAMQLLNVSRDVSGGALVDIDVSAELSDADLQLLRSQGALPLLWSQAQSLDTQSLALVPLEGATEPVNALWQITDSYSGSWVIAAPANSVQRQVDVAPELLDGLTVDDVLMGELSPEQAEALDALALQLQQLHELQEMNGDAAVPVVTFTPLPVQPWHTMNVREGRLEAVQFVEAAGGKATPISAPLADAIGAADLSQLSDNELAELDVLIERIAQQALKRDVGPVDFQKALGEHVAQLSESLKTHEVAQPSVHSASHAIHQTRSDDGLQLRVLQAQPAFEVDTPATEQVRVTINQAFRAGLDRVVIQLEPQELGRVDVRLDLANDGRANIQIVADNRDTLDLLQRDARMLERALQEAGIDANAQNMEFNLSERDQGPEDSGTNAANQSETDNEQSAQALIEPVLDMDALSASYTLSIAQGLDIKV